MSVEGEAMNKLGFGVSGPLTMSWFAGGKARKMIRTAFNAGVRRFDTASFYGDGAGEVRIAAALGPSDMASCVISTKTGTRAASPGKFYNDFSASSIRRDVEGGLERLGVSKLDLVYLHGPSQAETADGLETLRGLQSEGLVSRIGVCGDGELLHHAVEEGADAIMARFNFLDERHLPIFAEAKRKQIEIVGIAPLARAIYSADFNRVRTMSDVWRRMRAARSSKADLAKGEAMRGGGPGLLAAALCYALREPLIDICLATTTNPAHLTELLSAAKQPYTDDMEERLATARRIASAAGA